MRRGLASVLSHLILVTGRQLVSPACQEGGGRWRERGKGGRERGEGREGTYLKKTQLN